MDIKKISKTDFTKVCRICLQIKKNVSSDRNTELFNKLHFSIGLKLEQDDNLPNLFCNSCIEHINTMYDFKKLCLCSQQILSDLLKNDSVNPKENNFKDEQINNFDNEFFREDNNDSVIICDDIKTDTVKDEDVNNIFVNEMSIEDDENDDDAPLKDDEDGTEVNKPISLMLTNLIKRKVEKLEGTDRYRCTLCGKETKLRCHLRKHMLLHIPREHRLKYCTICGKAYTRMDTYAKHLRGHENQRKGNEFEDVKIYKCSECQRLFDNQDDLDKHKIIHIPKENRTYKCSDCHRLFNRQDHLDKHKLVHIPKENRTIHCLLQEDVNLPNLFCKSCIEHINTMYDFKKLCLYSQQVLADVLKNNPVNQNVNVNDEDINNFDIESNNGSFDEDTDSAIIACDDIKKDAIKDENINDDIVKKKSSVENEEDNLLDNNTINQSISLMLTNLMNCNAEKLIGADCYRCTLCGKVCRKRDNLRTHMLKHIPKEQRTIKYCTICGKTYTRKDTYAKHLRDHEDDNFQTKELCKFCGKTFSQLKNHIRRVHSDEKPYECSKCDKKFSVKVALQTHITSIHNGIKRVKLLLCPQCGRTLQSQRDLDSHMAYHAGQKPYKCTLCEFECTWKSGLNYHMRKKHSNNKERKLKCTLCDKKLTNRTVLKNHLRTHTGERPFACKICQKKFTQSSSLATHMKTHKIEKI